jgi:hypothetical protein
MGLKVPGLNRKYFNSQNFYCKSTTYKHPSKKHPEILGTSPLFNLPLHSFQKRVTKPAAKRANKFTAVGIATASRKNARQ